MSESVAGRLAIISADPPITYPCIVSPNVDSVGELYARQVQLLHNRPLARFNFWHKHRCNAQ